MSGNGIGGDGASSIRPRGDAVPVPVPVPNWRFRFLEWVEPEPEPPVPVPVEPAVLNRFFFFFLC